MKKSDNFVKNKKVGRKPILQNAYRVNMFFEKDVWVNFKELTKNDSSKIIRKLMIDYLKKELP